MEANSFKRVQVKSTQATVAREVFQHLVWHLDRGWKNAVPKTVAGLVQAARPEAEVD